MFRTAFQELFPDEEVPDILSAACCAQFAVTRDTVLAHPRQDYVKWRQWIIDTGLDDEVSGRVWEYLWQYVFPGPNRSLNSQTKAVSCPKEHICYCDGYGYCFGSEEKHKIYFARRERANDLRERLKKAEEDRMAIDDDWRREGMDRVRAEIRELDDLNEAEVIQARIRGKDPELRRKEVGSEFSG